MKGRSYGGLSKTDFFLFLLLLEIYLENMIVKLKAEGKGIRRRGGK